MKLVFSISIEILLLIMVSSCLKEKPATPMISTTAITGITQTTATSGGEVINDGGASVTSRGVCWSTSPDPTTEDSKTTESGGTGSFTSNITQLTPTTMYYVRAYGTNSAGTGYGNQILFTSKSVTNPTLTTSEVISITPTSAVSGGNIVSDGGASIIERGICWGTDAYPTISNNKTIDGSGTGSFTSNISGLNANTIYYLRAYASNSAWTSYGNVVTFTPAQYYQVTDIEGNEYNAVTIGTQIWMKENLKTTRYNDGTSIPNVTENAAWADLTSAAYCWYNNDESTYKALCGALYNWHAVNEASNGGKNLCPTGWHLPSQAEWTILTDYLINNGYGYEGSESVIGKSLASTSGWVAMTDIDGDGKLDGRGSASDDQGSNNSSGFAGYPGGSRSGKVFSSENDGTFYSIGYCGIWWSVMEYEYGGSFILANRQIVANGGDVINGPNQYDHFGFSVRCLKDN
jgi:uncharacterized protein (TIGR02145 family)